MPGISSIAKLFNRAVSAMLITCLLFITSAFAQSRAPVYAIELVVPDNKKAVETDADITFGETSFKVVPDKGRFQAETREIAYADIKVADKSFAKKPMLSAGGAVATLLLGYLAIFAVPFLFIKKKRHWMTVQSENEFAVLKLGDRNFRQIVAEFESRGVKVNDLGDEKNYKDDQKKDDKSGK